MSNAISLKESFRYMNHLEKNISSLISYIRNTNNSIKVTENHLKSKSNSEVKDEEIDMTNEHTYPNASTVDITFLINQLVDQKLKLSLAIEDSKKNLFLDWKENGINLTLDSGVEYAKKNRDLANNLKCLVDLKPSESKSSGTDYKFNVEGNQVAYKYTIEKKVTIDFDRNIINDLYKKLLNKADTLSTQIESAMLKEIVEFIPIYDIHDSITEIVDKYLANKNNK
jgi:hypothetical protein